MKLLLVSISLLVSILKAEAFVNNVKIVVGDRATDDCGETTTTRGSVSLARRTNLKAVKEGTFGMGCFWKPSEELLKVKGVIDTKVGYTGHPQATEIPSYDSVCFSREWVEGVRVTYDDEQVSYAELLDAFFEAQEPKLGSRQYASIIFAHDETQKQVASQWLSENETRIRSDGIPAAITVVEPLSAFYKAEGYHQEYWQKTRPRLFTAVILITLMTMTNPHTENSFLSSPELQSAINTGAETIFMLGAIYVLLERFLDKKVVEI